MERTTLEVYRPFATKLLFALVVASPSLVNAQARDSPFSRGLSGLQTEVYAWLSPIAFIALLVLAVLAWTQQLSGRACAWWALGIALGFGAPQIIVWMRDLFSV